MAPLGDRGQDWSETKFRHLLLKYSQDLHFHTKQGYIWKLTLYDPLRGRGQGQDNSCYRCRISDEDMYQVSSVFL